MQIRGLLEKTSLEVDWDNGVAKVLYANGVGASFPPRTQENSFAES